MAKEKKRRKWKKRLIYLGPDCIFLQIYYKFSLQGKFEIIGLENVFRRVKI